MKRNPDKYIKNFVQASGDSSGFQPNCKIGSRKYLILYRSAGAPPGTPAPQPVKKPTIKTSGSCPTRLESKEACEKAAKQVGFPSLVRTENTSAWPVGCYKYTSTTMYYNAARSATKSCSNKYPCVCK